MQRTHPRSFKGKALLKDITDFSNTEVSAVTIAFAEDTIVDNPVRSDIKTVKQLLLHLDSNEKASVRFVECDILWKLPAGVCHRSVKSCVIGKGGTRVRFWQREAMPIKFSFVAQHGKVLCINIGADLTYHSGNFNGKSAACRIRYGLEKVLKDAKEHYFDLNAEYHREKRKRLKGLLEPSPNQPVDDMASREKSLIQTNLAQRRFWCPQPPPPTTPPPSSPPIPPPMTNMMIRPYPLQGSNEPSDNHWIQPSPESMDVNVRFAVQPFDHTQIPVEFDQNKFCAAPWTRSPEIFEMNQHSTAHPLHPMPEAEEVDIRFEAKPFQHEQEPVEINIRFCAIDSAQ